MQGESEIWQELTELARGNDLAAHFFLGYLKSSIPEEKAVEAIREYRAYKAGEDDRAAARAAERRARLEELDQG